MLRLHFIAQNKQALYETLLITNKLTHHLLLVSNSCENYYKELMENYIENMKDYLKKATNKFIALLYKRTVDPKLFENIDYKRLASFEANLL